jgi:hypothetical protein
MNKIKTNVFLMVALLCGLLFFANCGGAKTDNTAATNSTSSGDSVGVPECDEYIKKYEACVNTKIPDAQRGTFKSSLDTLRKSWKDAAANPQSKAGLATGCKAALDQAKTSMASFGCAW